MSRLEVTVLRYNLFYLLWYQAFLNTTSIISVVHVHLKQEIVQNLSESDVAIWGYDKTRLFDKVHEAKGTPPPEKEQKWRFDSYRLRRKVFLALRKDIHQNNLGKMLRQVKFYCDVLLRE